MSEAEQQAEAPVPPVTPSPEPASLADWELRPWLLAALGALTGLAMWLLLDNGEAEAPWRFAGAALVFFAGVAAAFTLDRGRVLEAAIFSALLGAVMGGVAFLVTDAGERLAGEEYAFGAGVFFSLLSVPLFQAGFHRTRFATPYRETHFHVWTDAVSAGGAIAFMGLSWLLLWLLDALFGLIGLNFVEDLIATGWFSAMFVGSTFGAAMGVLRNQLAIIGTLQRVVMLVFSLLAVPFAAALLVFLVILLASGGNALWNATDAATPVLLSCAIGAFILANAVVRDDDAARSPNVVMQTAALALAAVILPLAVFAAISMGIRIDQHGLAPARIWGLIAVVIACAYGVAYWAGLARGRLAGWSHYLRRANLHLAAVTCVIALLLSLPLLDFGAISARNQLSRLEGGVVSTEKFDFTALRWDFGDAGRAALATLAKSGNAEAAKLAKAAQLQESRPYGFEADAERTDRQQANIRIAITDPALAERFRRHLEANAYLCSEHCVALDAGDAGGGRHVVLVQNQNVQHFLVKPGEGIEEVWLADGRIPSADPVAPAAFGKDTRVEVRQIEARQVFADGKPVGQPFE